MEIITKGTANVVSSGGCADVIGQDRVGVQILGEARPLESNSWSVCSKQHGVPSSLEGLDEERLQSGSGRPSAPGAPLMLESVMIRMGILYWDLLWLVCS